ncbi:integrase catalytic domain-containing protein [Trichonephila clavipes]|nr:integrase catalytic domain-containing protein [Trichonephila clavipes]
MSWRLLIEIEGVLNSRPLTYIFSEFNEPEPLTPSHMILGRRVNSLPPARLNFDSNLSNRKVLIKRNDKSKNNTKLNGETAHVCQGLLCPSGIGVNEHKSQSGGQSEAKNQLFSARASLVLIYQPTEGIKVESTLPNLRIETPTCGVEARHNTTRPS